AGLEPGVHRRRLLAARHGHQQFALPRAVLLQRASALPPRLQPGRDRHPAHCPVRQRGAVLPFPYGPQPGESPMALKENPRPNPWAARLHFLVRFAGLTGFVAAIAGLVIALVQNLGPDAFLPALQGESGDLVAQVAAYLLAVGGGLLLLLLLVEALVALV